MPTEELMDLKETKDKRKLHTDKEWQDFKDLTHAFSRFDKTLIERLSKKLLSGIFSDYIFNYKIDLDYQRNYFIALNYFVFPWIDFNNHLEFVDWLNKNIFNKSNNNNSDLIDFVQNIMTEDLVDKIRGEISEIINRFIDIKEFLHYAYNEKKTTDSYASVEGFVQLKFFFTDCFEFIGRNSQLIFRLQNFYERGSQNSVPQRVPRNVTNVSDFASLDNGRKLEIIKLSTEIIPQKIYTKSFDNKIRNGINHFKTKFDLKSQIISYYPITSRPDKKYQINYIDFLNLVLDIFNSVLKIGQLIKFVNIYKAMLDSVNERITAAKKLNTSGKEEQI